MNWPESLQDLPTGLLDTHVWVAGWKRSVVRESIDDRLAALELEAAAQHLLNHYAFCYDAGNLDGLLEIYTDDCVLVNRHGTFVGRDGIRANYARAIAGRQISFHHVSNVAVRPSASGTEAWVAAYIHNLAVRDDNATGAMASCVLQIRADSKGVWKISSVRIVVSNQHAYGPRQPATGAGLRQGQLPPMVAADPER